MNAPSPLPIQAIMAQPWAQDFFDLLRRIERDRGLKASGSGESPPRIGEATTRRDDYVRLGQDPYFAFPASTVAAIEPTSDDGFRILVKFLGLLGPQGALPLATTEEAYGWLLARDDAFPRFLDLFNHRFLQLFFRAWADARPIAQHDRPDRDRFVAYIGSAAGMGSEPYLNRDSLSDWSKLGYAGLLGAKAKSASRLRDAIRGLFFIEAEIEQFVGAHLAIDPQDHSRLGGGFATLGDDCMIGSSYFSIQDKFRIRLRPADLEQYCRFLPAGVNCEKLVDLVFFYLGEEFDWDIELAIPAKSAPPIQLGGRTADGESAAAPLLGWTSWLAPEPNAEGYRSDAIIHAANQIGCKRQIS